MSLERLATWAAFRTELEQIFRVRAASMVTPMDVGALCKGDALRGKPGGKGDNNKDPRACFKCGTTGHLAKDCRGGGRGGGK
eukprot:8655747-Karenia_brevis.AAC.1